MILVYSDLSSRRYAMGSFQSTAAMEGRDSSDLLRELGNGHPAAARFARDLAATRSLASETSPLPSVPTSSQRTAELLLLIRYVETANAGCDSRGGTVITNPPKIIWHHEESEPYRDGTIGGIWFTADLGADGVWQIDLSAC